MNNIQRQIFDHILERFRNGEFREGDRIPTEMELSALFKTGRMNAHYAVRELEKAGLVSRNKKTGTTARRVEDIDSLSGLRAGGFGPVYIMSGPLRPQNFHWNEGTLAELETALNKNGRRAVYTDFPQSSDALASEIKKASALGADSIVLLPAGEEIPMLMDSSALFEGFAGEVYFLDRCGEWLSEFPLHILCANPRAEGVIAGRYLISKGVSRAVFLTQADDSGCWWASERGAGLMEAYKKFAPAGAAALTLNIQLPGGFDSALDIVRGSAEKTAFVCRNDDYAATFIEFMGKRGLRCPDAFYVIGFDNNPELRTFNLTTVAPPSDKIGKCLAEMVCANKWRRRDGASVIIKLDSRLIQRGTC
jgi:DNA-binding LacI/PurR family transcriptional regulator